MKIVLVFGLMFLAMLAEAQEMYVRVEGVVAFDGSNFTINEAGEDFASSIESESSLVVSVDSNDEMDKSMNPNRKWRIDILKEDLIWEGDIQLEIIRTGDGYSENKNKIYDGTSYQVVDEISRYFFRGRGVISEIPIQLRLSGFSVTQGAQDFETNIVLTIYDD